MVSGDVVCLVFSTRVQALMRSWKTFKHVKRQKFLINFITFLIIRVLAALVKSLNNIIPLIVC